ncbi:Metallocarboxypeptidase A-like protein [Zalerion maritima]|uniref:Metallocarboxypeptidase A-like protein n=1 Tax=Zalerion maritima TaxID=339359 RepID=A0AAD5S076_9PEZI|nr:Metallocarboxypeptidase A-like protein [Zalerion maritima]
MVTYDGYKVFRVPTHQDLEAVKGRISTLNTVSLNLDNKEHLDIAVAPADVTAFEDLGLKTEVLHKDLGADIAVEAAGLGKYPELGQNLIPGLEWFDSYHLYADHAQYFKDLAKAFPKNTEIFSAGTSYHNQDMFGIQLWGKGGKGSKPAVYFHGTVHAREWISTMVVEYITYQLLTNYNEDETVGSILDAYDFYIIPFVNPDGFVYTQTSDRLWRKNRQPRSGSSCIGTDINRNWPYKWSVPGGASTNKCEQTYKGEAEADTPEVKGLLDFTKALTNDKGIKLFIDWHSYGQYILYPWGYDCSLAAPNAKHQDTLAAGLSSKIRESYGTRFRYGGSCEILYATTGDSTDYMTGVAGAELSWTIELTPQSNGGGGFILPASQILPSAKEQWEGMMYLLLAM